MNKHEEPTPDKYDKYQALFEASTDAILLETLDGHILDCNKTACNMFGYAKDKLLKLTMSHLIPQKASFILSDIIHEVQKKGGISLETLNKRKNGKVFPIELSAKLITIGIDKLILVYVRDITEQKLAEKELKDAEEKLRKSEARYRAIFEQAADSIILVDTQNGELVDFNDSAYKNLGYTRKEFEKLRIPDFEVVETSEEVNKHFRKIIKNGYDSFETRHTRKNGEIRDIQVTSKAILISGKDYIQSIWHDVTEKKQAERALKKSEERFRQVTENAKEWIWEVDKNGMYTYASPVVKKILGYKPEELVGKKHFYDLFHPDSRKELKTAALRAFSQKEPFREFINKNMHKKGNVVWLSTSGVPILNSKGKLLGYRGADTNITERKVAENNFFSILESMTDGVCIMDNQRNIQYVNSSLKNDFGPFLKGQKCYSYFYNNFKKACSWCKIEKSQMKDKTISWECFFQKNNRTYYILNTPLHNYDGSISTLQIFHDITAQKSMERELLQLATAVEHAVESIMITDTKGNIQYVNPGFEKASGYSRREVMGKNARILKSGEHGEEFYKRLWKDITAGKAWRGHLVNKNKNGDIYEEEAVISPIRDNEGKIVNFVAIKRNVTHELALEKHLEHIQKIEAVSQLAGGMAHDFNNLLMVITNSALFAKKELPKNSKANADIDQIIKASQHASDITRKLLIFSRQQKLSPRIVDLNNAVLGVEKMFRRLIPENIIINIHPSERECLVKADTGQLEQVLVNLVLNARDAMPNGGHLSICIAHKRLTSKDAQRFPETVTLKSGNYILLSISDTGVGMDKKTKRHIFEPFFTTKKMSKGTGLGLSIVYGIIQQHGGYISVTSKPKYGTIFKIYLPQVGKEEIYAEENYSPAPPPQGNETILLVEDEKVVRNVSVQLLEQLGYTVLTAKNCKDALSLLRKQKEKIQLLIADLIMPEMSGNKLAEEAKKINHNLKSLFISGYSDRDLAAMHIDTNGNYLLSKPFTLRDIAIKVREVLEEKPSA